MSAFLDETMARDDDAEVWIPELDGTLPTDGHDVAGDE